MQLGNLCGARTAPYILWKFDCLANGPTWRLAGWLVGRLVEGPHALASKLHRRRRSRRARILLPVLPSGFCFPRRRCRLTHLGRFA